MKIDLDFETHYELSRIPVRCKKCGKAGTVETVMNCPIDLAVACMKALRCPCCHATVKHLMILTGTVEWNYPAVAAERP
jgi:hypothetical protein